MSKAENLAGLLDANGDVLATNLDNVSVAFADVTSKPTTLAGYGITDAASDTELTTAVANSSNWDTAYGWGDHSTQGYATTTYVDTAVSGLVDSAPATLDTLNELAAALGDDPNYATTVTTALGLKANSADLATVATTGAYSDLSGTPTIPTLSTLGIANHDSVTVDANGNVGIGISTVDTGAKLHVYKGNSGGTSNTAAQLVVENSDHAYIQLLSGNTSNRGIFFGDSTDPIYGYIGYNNTDYMQFGIGGAERVRIESDGDLHADGDVIAYSTTISDIRLKDNIVGINNALAKVGQLNGYTFEYKADGKVSAGVIAQEVEAVLPEAVSEKQLPLKTDDDQEYKVVNYDALHGLLIEAIKELAERVEALEAK